MARQNQDGQIADLIDLREAEIAKISESKEDVAALRRHLHEIIEGKSFKGSHRSGQFLAYVVEKSIAGHFDSLKERVIGVELFGRSPSYDTGEDAIVRVTASDVRKRLLQHYGENGTASKFRLSLPSGSYIPEITRVQSNSAEVPVNVRLGAHPAAHETVVADSADREPATYHSAPAESPAQSGSRGGRMMMVAIVLLVFDVFLGSFFLYRSSRVHAGGVQQLPWSVFFSSPHPTHLITSDPNIVSVQEITGNEISLSDYANRKYISEPNNLSPEVLRLCHIILWGDNSAAAIDPPIAVRIAALAQTASKKIDARAARSIQLSDLKTDDNFIFLGSPRSNPWSSLFSDQLDFRFQFDKASGQEILRNVHPRANEQAAYIPTAAGWATGRSYAIIAFVQNPDQNGPVLLLAGADGEGTEAAGKLVTNLPRLSTALNQCGIRSGHSIRHFEMLLQLSTMAGSPNEVDVVACHALSGVASR